MSKTAAKQERFAVWATAWGPMGAVATDRGVSRIVLPHYQRDDLAELLAWEHPGAAAQQGPFEQLIELSRQYFNAKEVDFGEVACDLPPAGSFSGMVYRACRQIPYGRTAGYSRVAEQIRRPHAARAVATAMSKNPIPLVVPCHRIIYADGRPGGFSAPGGVAQKTRMLDLERRVSDRQ